MLADCNAELTVSGTSSCTAGSLTPAACQANSCDASAAPTNGGVAVCTVTVADEPLVPGPAPVHGSPGFRLWEFPGHKGVQPLNWRAAGPPWVPGLIQLYIQLNPSLPTHPLPGETALIPPTPAVQGRCVMGRMLRQGPRLP